MSTTDLSANTRNDATDLQPQFANLAQQHVAGQLGMWVFLVTELMFFGGMFCSYTIYRGRYFEAFRAGSEHLKIALGTTNTAVLLGSSLTVALAVRAAKSGRRSLVVGWLLATIVLGTTFLVIKFTEWGLEYHESLLPGWAFSFEEKYLPEAQLFFSLYFIMTGVHGLHMIIGVAAWLCLTAWVWRVDASNRRATAIEITGLYWHFVDIIWIFLFPLLYLI